jgi:hypothetical protein
VEVLNERGLASNYQPTRLHENHIPMINPETARQLVDTAADDMRQL